jgi:hypothetical protein
MHLGSACKEFLKDFENEDDQSKSYCKIRRLEWRVTFGVCPMELWPRSGGSTRALQTVLKPKQFQQMLLWHLDLKPRRILGCASDPQSISHFGLDAMEKVNRNCKCPTFSGCNSKRIRCIFLVRVSLLGTWRKALVLLQLWDCGGYR